MSGRDTKSKRRERERKNERELSFCKKKISPIKRNLHVTLLEKHKWCTSEVCEKARGRKDTKIRDRERERKEVRVASLVKF